VVAFFRIACTPRHGLAMGRFLLGLGHRKIAYISPYYKNLWSMNRHAGLLEAFEGAGIMDGVVKIGAEDYDSVWHLAGDPSARSKDTPSPYLRSLVSIRTEAEELLDACRGKIPKYVYRRIDNIRGQCQNIDAEYAERRYTLPLFEKAFAYKNITAWVGENDGIAMLGWAFCIRKGVRVPQDISIIGFDNTPEAHRNSLSTYSFNLPVAAHMMLSFIINPQIVPRPHYRKPIEIDGMVIRRCTTARNRTSP
jgi:DNA-binding LacI/PurR family transcriptional regulator